MTKKIKEDKVRVIHNGIDISQFNRPFMTDQLKNTFGIERSDFVVTIVGRLSMEKGHDIFLKAAEKITKEKKNVKFLIIGDGPLKETLKSQAKNLHLEEKVIFTGIRSDMPEIYSISDILVNSSFIEGLPMTILEAMASKVAIIATRVGAIPQVIKHGINGILLDSGDYEGLAREICFLMDQPNKRKALFEQAYKDVCENFSASKMADQYTKIYQEILN